MEEEEEGGDVDESGVEAKDVELVMTQVPPPPPLTTPAHANMTAELYNVIPSNK